jgi:hypothetical protein
LLLLFVVVVVVVVFKITVGEFALESRVMPINELSVDDSKFDKFVVVVVFDNFVVVVVVFDDNFVVVVVVIVDNVSNESVV